MSSPVGIPHGSSLEASAPRDDGPSPTTRDLISTEELLPDSIIPNTIDTAAAVALSEAAASTFTDTPTTTRTDLIECPRPTDVLMPIDGYQLWAGNVRYSSSIGLRKQEFLTAGTRSEQARIALEIVHGIQKAGGRFLSAVSIPLPQNSPAAAASSIVATTAWKRMSETEILGHLGKALRDDFEQDKKKDRKKRRKEKKQRRRERRRARRRVVLASDDEQQPEGALESLYYVPSYYPTTSVPTATSVGTQLFGGGKYDDDSDSLSSSSTSSEEDGDEEHLTTEPKKKKRGAPKKATTAATKKAKKQNFTYKPKTMKSQQASKEEGDAELPKGVTVRPSGKWQAQTYFAGQSRYVGVYDSSRLAARAYVVVQDYLKQYRGTNSICKTSPKEELAKIFGSARKAADDAVKELMEEISRAQGPPQADAAYPTPAAAPATAPSQPQVDSTEKGQQI